MSKTNDIGAETPIQDLWSMPARPDPILAKLDLRALASDPEAARRRAAEILARVEEDLKAYRRVARRCCRCGCHR